IGLDVPNRRLDLLVEDREVKRRLEDVPPMKPHFTRGYGWMYSQHIMQADKGCDFDFLRAENLVGETSRNGEAP
ncbi:MAG: dihydroxy-acid dehydratase, partial [Chloroflexi bacterium]|nr:dihydroxy-acid dehydratase [Chloroflexota bacterium]